jgi:hypothetical protein
LVGLFRQAIGKRVGSSDIASKLAYRRSGSFFARFTRAVTLCVIGLPSLLDGCACGGTPFFLREKRAGFRAAALSLSRSFRRSETAKATHKPTQRQSGRQRRPGLQSKLKKGLEAEGELARKSDSKPFFNQTAAT